MVIFDPTLEEEARQRIIKITSLIEKEKCVVTDVDKWGIRKLAYPIKNRKMVIT